MPVIGVTGGVATGKSTAAKKLISHFAANSPVALFSADQTGRDLLENNPDILAEIRSAFGNAIFESDGKINRTALRDLIFSDSSKRQRLESILHPAIRAAWTSRCAEYRVPGKYFLAEIPLLYETQAELWFDCVIVVAASGLRQMQRLAVQRGWSLETARLAIDSQMPLADKIHRADILIWNDHTEALLEEQIQTACRSLKTRYA